MDEHLRSSSEKLSDVLYRTDDAKLTFMAHMQCTSLYSSHAVAKAFDLSNFGSCCDLGGKFHSYMISHLVRTFITQFAYALIFNSMNG